MLLAFTIIAPGMGASAGFPSPVSMTAEITMTSIVITEIVRINVPSGSPRMMARQSAWHGWLRELC